MNKRIHGKEEKSSLHEWINSVGVILALCLSAVGGYFNWYGIHAKQEALSVSAVLYPSCKAMFASYYIGDETYGLTGVCWAVTLANRSENKLSVVRYSIEDSAQAPDPVEVDVGILRDAVTDVQSQLQRYTFEYASLLKTGEYKSDWLKRMRFEMLGTKIVQLRDDRVEGVKAEGFLESRIDVIADRKLGFAPGETVSLPFSIEGNDVKSFVVRMPMKISGQALQYVLKSTKSDDSVVSKLSVSELQAQVEFLHYKSKHKLLPTSLIEDDTPLFAFGTPGTLNKVLKVTTGRGNTFSGPLRFEP